MPGMKRIRWSKAELAQLDEQIMKALEPAHPQSVRHIFYLMTNPRLPRPVEKTEKGYKRVQRRCVDLRRARLLPYDWIVDMTRRGHYTPTYDSPAMFIKHHASAYRVDPWARTKHWVEVWTESRSIAGVIEATCRDYAVSLYPSGGFTSLSLGYEAAEQVLQKAGDRPVEIVYIGDYDPAGVLIDRSIMKELYDHLGPNVKLHRIAVTQEQIAQYDLPTKPRKASERRRRDIEETVEAEAMPVELLLRLLRKQLDVFLPDGALKEARERERETSAALLHLAKLVAEGEDGLYDVILSRLLVKYEEETDAASGEDDGSDNGGGSSA